MKKIDNDHDGKIIFEGIVSCFYLKLIKLINKTRFFYFIEFRKIFEDSLDINNKETTDKETKKN